MYIHIPEFEHGGGLYCDLFSLHRHLSDSQHDSCGRAAL